MTDENIGRVVAQKYELVRLLGKGGMGAVYEGKNQIGKRVAVKLLLKAEFAQSPELTARFFREAQASAAVESKHVVDVYDTGVDADTGFPFIVMAHLRGEDLEHVLARVGALNPVAAVRLVSQAATGLAKAHEAGIVHRDIKPANLFLAADESESVVKILDFGIAKLTASGLGEANGLTQTGAMLGTPLYMSPEQAQGLKTVDARTDLWSLGMCLYEALAGRLPFDDVDTIGKLIVAVVAHDVKPLASVAPWVDPELAAVVHRTLSREVTARISTARELVAALRPFTGGSLLVTVATLVGVKDTLDATLLPGALVTTSPPQSGAGIPASSTTAGFASERTAPATSPRRTTLAVGGLLAIAALAVGAHKLLGVGPEPAAANETVATSAPSAAAPTSSTEPPDELKVGVVTLRLPEGFTVTVDGFVPGTPETHGASRITDGTRLELRGEFQRRFLVAVFDKGGKRAMVQDVYLYDNKADPDSIDPRAGVVVVDKPRRKPPAVRVSPTPSAAASSDLPPRF
jgi:serine/threonine protein kinase